jgi:hypothetical protein
MLLESTGDVRLEIRIILALGIERRTTALRRGEGDVRTHVLELVAGRGQQRRSCVGDPVRFGVPGRTEQCGIFPIFSTASRWQFQHETKSDRTPSSRMSLCASPVPPGAVSDVWSRGLPTISVDAGLSDGVRPGSESRGDQLGDPVAPENDGSEASCNDGKKKCGS